LEDIERGKRRVFVEEERVEIVERCV